MIRKTTACNDNYRQDKEEEVIFSNFTKSNSEFADSVEGWCFTGACANDDNSFNVVLLQ